MGNAVTDDYHDYIGTFEYWWNHGLISDSTYHQLKTACYSVSSQHPSLQCMEALRSAELEQGNIDPYSIFTKPCNNTVQLKSFLKGRYVSFIRLVLFFLFFYGLMLHFALDKLSHGCQELMILAQRGILMFTLTGSKFRRLYMLMSLAYLTLGSHAGLEKFLLLIVSKGLYICIEFFFWSLAVIL